MTVKINVKPELGHVMVEWIHKLKAYATEKEPGTLEYTFARKMTENDGELIYVVWERYKDLEAFKM